MFTEQRLLHVDIGVRIHAAIYQAVLGLVDTRWPERQLYEVLLSYDFHEAVPTRHKWLNNPTLADAILDRIVHVAHKIALTMRISIRIDCGAGDAQLRSWAGEFRSKAQGRATRDAHRGYRDQ